MKLTKEQAEQLYELFTKTQDALYNRVNRWSEVYDEKLAFIKTVHLVWARIRKELGLESCCAKFSKTEDCDLLSFADELHDDICDIAYDETLAKHSVEAYTQAGIDIIPVWGELSYDEIPEVDEDDGTITTAEFASDVFDEFAEEFPEFVDVVLRFTSLYFCELFHMVGIKSLRVGQFKKNESKLLQILPVELTKKLDTLIGVIFCPYYWLFPDLVHAELNDKGEYCGFYSSVSMGEGEGEETTALHRMPFGDVSVYLLDHYLSEAEALAPELLCAKETTASDNSKAA